MLEVARAQESSAMTKDEFSDVDPELSTQNSPLGVRDKSGIWLFGLILPRIL
jgi:hypothetical protein